MKSWLSLIHLFGVAAFFVSTPAFAQAPSATVPSRGTSIADFGAIGDGATLNTERIQSAVNQLAEKGGGTVVIPKGVFLSGAIFLKPGVNLHLDRKSVV